MITKPCARCRKLIPYGKRYCDTCAPIVAAETEEQKKRANRRYNKSRDKNLEQFYNGKRWRITSKKYLDRHPKCQKSIISRRSILRRDGREDMTKQTSVRSALHATTNGTEDSRGSRPLGAYKKVLTFQPYNGAVPILCKKLPKRNFRKAVMTVWADQDSRSGCCRRRARSI